MVKNTPRGVCLNFWYHAYGKTVGKLNVYTRKRAQLSAESLWSISGDQGDQWKPAAVTITEYEDFQVNLIK